MIKVNNEEIQFETFPNGETRMLAENLLELIENNDELCVNFKYGDDSDLIKLMFVKKYIERQHSGVTHLKIYYMPYSRMDRSENESPFTLKYVSDFINGLNFYTVEVIEPHSDVTCALLNNTDANYINFNLIDKIKEDTSFIEDVDYIVFPDTGASKRYANMSAKNVLVGHKHRNFKTGEIEKLELIGNINHHGTKAIIVDDLSSYGGTFVRTAIELKKLGIEEVYLLVAHAENSVFKGELFDHIDKLFCTNSVISKENHWNNVKFKPQLKIYDIEEILKK